MKLSRADIERLIEWGRIIFLHTEEDWSIADDQLITRLVDAQVGLASISTDAL